MNTTKTHAKPKTPRSATVPDAGMVPVWASTETVRRIVTVLLGIAAIVIALFPVIPNRSAQSTVIIALVVAIGAVGLNIITGYTGYLSIGHFAFIGVGAYFVAILTKVVPGVPPLVWVPVAGLVTALLAVLLGLVTYRSRGPSFVIISIALLFLMRFIATEWKAVTNGTSGITMPMYSWPREWGNWPIHLSLVVLLGVSLALSGWIRRTKFGLGLIAIREDEGKAGTVGVNSPVYKLLAFAASALLVGMAGGVYGYFMGFVDPVNMFSILLSVQLVLAVILGGRGTLFGPVLGAFIVVPLDIFANNTGGGGNTRLVMFGLLLIFLVVLLPKGILPSLSHHLERIRTRGTAGLSGTRLGAADELSVRDRPKAPDPSELEARLEAAPAILEVEGLSKSFGGNQAVNDCTFTVPEGSITGLIGPNGSGKTTVFNLISGTLLPDAGTVRIGGTDISRMPSWGRAHRGLGRTFQSTRLFKEMSVLENIAAPLGSFSLPQMGLDAVSGKEAERARELLDFVGLSRYEQAKAGSLSYGQQKLVELAQVLVLDPKLILLDEPAGGINPTLIERMGDLIRDLNAQGKTFLLVEHNMPFVLGLCNPVRVLAQGHVIATGSPDEIQKNDAVIDAYLGDDYLLDSDNSATTRMAVEGSAS